MRYYEELLKGSQALTDQWLDAVERVVPNRPGDHRQPSDDVRGPRLIPMSLHAMVGETARGSISLRNNEQEESEISFLVSDFTGSDGRSVRPAVKVVPERFVLGPYEERTVLIEVELHPDHFPPGQLFRAAVAVRGYDNLELSLTVWSDE